MYPKEFFLEQFKAEETDELLRRYASAALTDEAKEAILSLLQARGVDASSGTPGGCTTTDDPFVPPATKVGDSDSGIRGVLMNDHLQKRRKEMKLCFVASAIIAFSFAMKSLGLFSVGITPWQIEIVMIIAFLARGVFLSHKISDHSYRVWLVLISLAVVCLGIVAYASKNSADEAIAEIRNVYSSFARSLTDAQGLPQRIEEIDTTPKTKGEFGEAERFAKTFINKQISQRNNYLLELDEIGWGKILDPERMKQDNGLIESKIIIQKAKDIGIKYRDQMHDLHQNTHKDISNLNINENSKREMARGFGRAMVESRHEIDAFWDLEAKIISEVESIFALPSIKNDDWVTQNGQFLFMRTNDLDAFNSHMAAIQDLVSKQEAIQKKAQKKILR